MALNEQQRKKSKKIDARHDRIKETFIMPLHGRKVIQLKWIANLIKCQRTQNIRKLKGGDNDSDAIDADVSFLNGNRRIQVGGVARALLYVC